jgi:hypothetical protein
MTSGSKKVITRGRRSKKKRVADKEILCSQSGVSNLVVRKVTLAELKQSMT